LLEVALEEASGIINSSI